MSATASDVPALRARLRAVTLGRLVVLGVLAATLAGPGRDVVDVDGAPLLVATATVHLLVQVVAMVLPASPSPQRLALEVTTIVDAAAISVVLVVTGGIVSPAMSLIFAEVVALTLVFGWWTGVRSATLLSLGLVWALSVTPPALADAIAGAAAADAPLAVSLDPMVRTLVLLVGLWGVTALVAALSGVTERELRRWLDDLALLRDVTRDLDPRLGVDRVCAALGETLVERVGFRSAVVWLTDRDAEARLRLGSTAGAVDGASPMLELRLSDTPVDRAVAAGTPTPVRRIDPRADVLTRVHGTDAPLVVVPLQLDQRLLAVVTAEVARGLTGPPSLAPRDLRRLRLLADEATLLLGNARLQAELRDLAVTDALTGLPNHGFLQQRLGEEVERVGRRAARGEQRPLSLALFDLDRFKQVNDQHGHPTGDEVLRAVARTCAEVVRSSDVACRYGGEEFAVVLVDTTGPEAVRACERIAEALRTMRVTTEDGTVLPPITASFGVSTTIGVELDRPGLIAAADEALYAAKRAGRDRVRHADDVAAELVTPPV
jgi:diguanylate cyclase (GGDEF)-like protein